MVLPENARQSGSIKAKALSSRKAKAATQRKALAPSEFLLPIDLWHVANLSLGAQHSMFFLANQ